MIRMGAIGRPRKTGGSYRDQKKRRDARRASSIYYKFNRDKILSKAKRKYMEGKK